ncbi:tRNA guanosine(34) transglycosylase Tgt [Patescibacteria group bacterium]|nr:tRNA guanosine(34) transglycosylase Tgt [Patescibacteria group bacterium]
MRKINIETKHGSVVTPFFMPDATRGLVKGLSVSDIKQTGIEAICVNTYHLYLQPGIEVIKKAGGIHAFMGWDGPILSDSGGFQVFSLIHRNKDMGKIYSDKVVFKSPINGALHELTPEKSIQIQFDLGVDMMVCLDDCPPNDASKKEIDDAVDHTINWAKRCKQEFEAQIKNRKITVDERPLLFGVIQGGEFLDLRKKCAEDLIKIGFDGYGYGAMPVDNLGSLLREVLAYTANLIPEDKLRFALGVGKPEDIIECYKLGWDMFDCVIPTREGRHGRLYKHLNTLVEANLAVENILNAKFKDDFSVVQDDSTIDELRTYSKAYLHHLFKIKDSFGSRLASLNNLEFYAKLMKSLRG